MSKVPKISCNIILIQHNVLEKITNIDIKKERLVALTAYSLTHFGSTCLQIKQSSK